MCRRLVERPSQHEWLIRLDILMLLLWGEFYKNNKHGDRIYCKDGILGAPGASYGARLCEYLYYTFVDAGPFICFLQENGRLTSEMDLIHPWEVSFSFHESDSLVFMKMFSDLYVLKYQIEQAWHGRMTRDAFPPRIVMRVWLIRQGLVMMTEYVHFVLFQPSRLINLQLSSWNQVSIIFRCLDFNVPEQCGLQT